MNKRMIPVALAFGFVASLPVAALARGGHGGGFHGGGFHGGGGGFHGGGFRGGGAPHMAAPRMAAPGFHGGSAAGFRGAGAGAAALHHGPSLNYSRGYAGMRNPGGFHNAAVNHNFNMARQSAFNNRVNNFRGNAVNNNRAIVNNMNAGNWHRGYWNGHWGNYGGNWGYGRGLGYGGYGGYGMGGLGYGGYGGYGGFGNPFMWGLGSGLGFGLGYGLLGGMGYGGYGGLGGYGMGYGGYGSGYGGYGMGLGGYGMGYGGYGGMLGWGLPSWGLGNWPYQYGYSTYVNPYYTTGGQGFLDYSQPLAVATAEPAQATVDTAGTAFSAARDAFKAGDYNTALQKTDEALKSLPNDVDLHEFRSLILFAQANYSQAAAGLYAVLDRAPGWNWATLSGLYPDVDTFTRQLRGLEKYVADNPKAASGRFVLAYLYMAMGSTEAAADQLREVVSQEPNDRLSRHLLADLSPPPAGEAGTVAATAPNTAKAAEEQPAGPPPPANLAGDWKAQGAGGTTIDLNVKPDNHFTWTTQGKDGPKSFSGTAASGSGILTLAASDGMVIVGRLTGTPDGGFKFKLVGGGPDDPGLTFSKASS